ncbi:MAG: GDYXXLXY domain-containing protein [Deltaproteobacteria bacterium]|nr:GDYXXLXY domain-containing protein [Deltaproteobacteria bacterium]
MKKYLLIAAVVFPIVVLLGLMFSKQARLAQGSQVILPIEGFDPRDLLSGHYLTYRINYGASPDCSRGQGGGQKLYACLSEEFGPEDFYRARFISQDDMADSDCTLFIAGRCENGRFAAGIEKFYIPEQYAAPLDRAVRTGKGKIVLKVSGSGSAVIQDLLIDGKSWREYKEQ